MNRLILHICENS